MCCWGIDICIAKIRVKYKARAVRESWTHRCDDCLSLLVEARGFPRNRVSSISGETQAETAVRDGGIRRDVEQRGHARAGAARPLRIMQRGV